MFKPLPLYVATRYLRAQRRQRFASFITVVSVLGIALGVAVLLVVLSVMNGFEREVSRHIVGLTAHGSVFHRGGAIDEWARLAAALRRHPRVLAVQPFIRGSGMLNHRGDVRGVVVYGIDPAGEATVSSIADYLGDTPLAALAAGGAEPPLFVGHTLAEGLGVGIGDTVTLIAPRWDPGQGLSLPSYRRVRIAGVFHAGMHEFDSAFALLNLRDAAAIFGTGEAVSGLRLRFDDASAAPLIGRELNEALGPDYAVIDWTQYHRNFFEALKSQKRIMFAILSLIVAVAAFNIVASMVMLVREKSRDIAILRTLGMAPRAVLATFVTQGVLIGAGGVTVGVLLGALGARHANSAMTIVERVFGVRFIKPDVYYIDYLPAQVIPADVIAVSAVAFAICVAATVYPAWRAAQIAPVEALRYD